MNPEHQFYVISNTHWDREWRFPFERTRAMLTELFDNLLELFEKHANFKVFHLDAHTIPLEDYLEVKPEKRPLLEKHVRDGRLLIGPWYTLPDGCSVSGEALVRNLLRGRQQAREFGRRMNVGYTPNGFGQPGQLPQLYAGFGIDSVLFYRGVDRANWTQEFIWEGPDGTRALAFRFGMYARYNFFFLVYRPTVHNMKAFECVYRWEQRGLPFHVCRDRSYEPYYLLQFKPHFEAAKILPGLEELVKVDAAGTTVPLVAAMMGCDSTAPDEVEGNIVDEANRQLGAPRVTHASLEQYVADVKRVIDPARLTLAKGEMRHTLQGGGQTYLHYDIYGTRVYLRQQGCASEASLEQVAEPAAAVAMMLGEEYPAGLLNLAWKLKLQNDAHDSIGGCAMDRVHEDVMNRFARLDDISEEVARMSLARLVPHINTQALPADATLLLLFNPLPAPRRGVLAAAVDFPREPETRGVDLREVDGTPVAAQATGRELSRPTVQKPNDIPSPYFATRHRLHLDAGEIPALGYKLLVARPLAAEPAPAVGASSLVTGPRSLENEHLRVTVRGNGTWDLLDKATGKTYRGLGLLEDNGEVGDPWLRISPDQDTVFTSAGCRATVTVLENGPLCARLQIDLKLRLPAGVTPDRKARSAERTSLAVRTVLILRKGARLLDCETTCDNRVRDHRLRLGFPTRLRATHACAHMQFDVVRRQIAIPKVEGWIEPPTGLEPNKWFVDVSNGRHGLAVIDQGITQYEVTEDARQAIVFTLMRCFQMRNSFQKIDYPDQPGTQCQGPARWRYAIYPHAGDYEAGGVLEAAAQWHVATVVAQMGTVEGGTLPTTASFLEITPAGPLVFSGIKPAEGTSVADLAAGRGDLIVRFWNAAEHAVTGTLRTRAPILRAAETRLDETELRQLAVDAGNGLTLTDIGPKKVVTVRLSLGKP